MITINNKDVADITTTNGDVFRVQDANTLEVMWEKKQDVNEYFYIKNAYNGTNTVEFKMYKSGSTSYTANNVASYSLNKIDWTPFNVSTESTTSVSLPKGKKLYIRTDKGSWNPNTTNYISIYCQKPYKVGGNIMSLVDYTDYSATMPEFCFQHLFQKNPGVASFNDNLLNARNLILPATTLTKDCYSYLFATCRELTVGPELPATTLANYCYEHMFSFCESLNKLPELPATTLEPWCYYGMFSYCYSLTNPPLLPATTLANGCYSSMFSACDSLTNPPLLPATTLADRCYDGMFTNCTSLSTAPALNATTLANYCYKQMFQGCTSLNNVTSYANNISASYCIYNWLDNVAQTGTFHNLGSATYPSGASGIPTGWTEVNS